MRAFVSCALALGAASADPLTVRAASGKAVLYEVVDLDAYASGVNNWDDEVKPVFCAAIGSPTDWDTVFFAAATGTPNQVFSPPEAFFSDRLLLLASRVVPGEAETRYDIRAVTRSGDEVTVDYVSTAKDAASSGYSVKSTVAASIPKNESTTVSFVENGRPVCQADIPKERGDTRK